MSSRSILVLLIAMAGLTPAAEELRFEDYPASFAFAGKPAAPRLRTPGQRMFRTAIASAEEKGPNFAGAFTIAEWGCGTACVSFVVVDARSGAVYENPFGSVPKAAVYLGPPPDPASTGLSYRLDSRLLVVAGCPNWTACARYYYEWAGDRFKLVQTIPFPPSDAMPAGKTGRKR